MKRKGKGGGNQENGFNNGMRGYLQTCEVVIAIDESIFS